MESIKYEQKNTIDLLELFKFIKERKKILYLVTGFITAVTFFYIFLFAKPIYEVKAMIEIGKIGTGTKEETPLDTTIDIKQKLEYLHGVHSKKNKTFPKLKTIIISKNSKNIFSIIVQGRDNTSASKYINDIVHQIENDYTNKLKSYVHTQKELIQLTKHDIQVNEENLKQIQKTFQNYSKKILNLTKKDAALAGIYTIQISQNQVQQQELQSMLSNLKTKIFKLKLSISTLRISKTHIVGKVEILDDPIKPKKILTIIMSFITGLMLSLLLIFLLESLHGIQARGKQ